MSRIMLRNSLPFGFALLAPCFGAFAQTSSTITDNISNALVANDFFWIEAHLTQAQFANAPASFTADIWITDASVSFTYRSVQYNIPLPPAQLTFSSSNGSTPTITYSGGSWQTGFPTSGSQNPFMTGVSYQVPSALNGFTIAGNGASLTASFSTDYIDKNGVKGDVSLNWQWSGAQYTQSQSDPNNLGVTPADGVVSSYHSGTPTALVGSLVAGGTGGGGSNYTGSNSGTASVTPAYLATSPVAVPETSTWAAAAFTAFGAGFTIYRRRARR